MAKKKKYITEDGEILVLIMFEGKVQQVSFRYTSNMYAVTAGMSGYCKNTDDFQVECLLKGYEDDIKLVIDKLIKEFAIRRTNVERLPIDYWESNALHYIDYGTHKAVYKPYVPPVNNGKSDLGLYGDYGNYDYGDNGGYNDRDDYYNQHSKNHLTQDDIDFINGRGKYFNDGKKK